MGTPFPLPVAALPTDSSAVPQDAGALTLLQSLSQLPALFLSVSSVSWSEHAAWGPQGDNLALKSVQYRSRSFQSSRTIPWPHQELKLTAAPRYKRTVSKITAQKQWWTQCFGSLGEQLFQGQHCGPLLPWEALRRPWNTWTSHSSGFKAFSAKSLWENPKEGELLPLLLQLASQFPQNVPRYHLTIIFQLPPYLQGRKSPGKAAAPQHGNAELMVKMLLSEPAPCLSHQPPEPFNKLPIQDSICSFIL